MPWFRCFIEGENFPGVLIGDQGLFGFYTTRWVEASDAEAAELIALDALRSDPKLQLESKDLRTDARVYFDEIVEVDGPGGPNTGFVWYPMDSGNTE